MINKILLFFKQNFYQGSVLKFLDSVWLVIIDWPHSWGLYSSREQKRGYVIFRIFKDALLLSLLRMSMAWFSLGTTRNSISSRMNVIWHFISTAYHPPFFKNVMKCLSFSFCNMKIDFFAFLLLASITV